MILDWHRPENLRPDYVPPIVAEGIVSAATFWEMAVSNARLRGDAPGLIAHAERMLARAQEERC